MEFRLVQREDTMAVGFSFVTTPFSAEIGQAWQRVHGNGDFQRLMDKSKQRENLGLCIMDPGLPEGSFRYMIAFDLDPAKAPDADMTTYLVKGGEYAVFHCPTIEEISPTFKRVYEEWMPTAAYEYDMDRPADFEYYYMGEGEVACDVYVPVKQKG